VCLAFIGCGGGTDARTQAFYDEVEARLCASENTARSIGRESAAFADEHPSGSFDAAAQQQLNLIIWRMESYFRKTARRMKGINAPPTMAADWRDLIAVYDDIHADARRARIEANQDRAGGGQRFLVRYGDHAAKAKALREKLALPMDCNR
jgi:hypothetical protein